MSTNADAVWRSHTQVLHYDMCNTCSGEDYRVIQAATRTANQIATGLHDPAIFADVAVEVFDPNTVQVYINTVAARDIPDEIDSHLLQCVHYYREVNLLSWQC